MTVNDIPYEHYAELLMKAQAFDSGLLDKAKFIKMEYGGHIRTDEGALLEAFRNMADCKEYWGSAIQAYCHEKNIQFSEFVSKYGIKDHTGQTKSKIILPKINENDLKRY